MTGAGRLAAGAESAARAPGWSDAGVSGGEADDPARPTEAVGLELPLEAWAAEVLD